MKQKELNLYRSFIYGFLSSMIVTFIYSAVIISLYILLMSMTPKMFMLKMISILDIWVWIWISISILYAFSVTISHIIRNKSKSFQNKISKILFFIITAVVVTITISYIPQVQKIFISGDFLFYIIIFSSIILLICIQVSFNIEKLIFFIYKMLLFNLGYDMSVFMDKKEEKEIFTSEYEMFFKTAENVIAFSQREKHSIGIIGFKIANYLDIIQNYGEEAYNNIEEQVINTIKNHARVGENQCLLQENTIYSLLYADEEEAWKTARRYYKALKGNNFEYGGENIEVNIAVAVSGFDFSENKSSVSLSGIRDNLMWKISDAISESQETGNPVVYYE